jgi:hypothetical protein
LIQKTIKNLHISNSILILGIVMLLGLSPAFGQRRRNHGHTPPPPTPPPVTQPPGGLWKPQGQVEWQWQLTSPVDQSVNASVYDIDLFDNDASVVASLHAAGRKAICYVDVGTWEDWRPDAASFPASVKGSGNGWPGEKWLDIRQLDVLGPIIGHRFDLCKAKGFDAIEPDNIDGYSNSTGFPLSYQDQIDYNRFIATAAHARGLSIGLKNDVEQVPDLLSSFDWAIDEECFKYKECDALAPFVSSGKAVLEVEYGGNTNNFCPTANAMGFSSMKKHLSLDAWRQPCF